MASHLGDGKGATAVPPIWHTRCGWRPYAGDYGYYYCGDDECGGADHYSYDDHYHQHCRRTTG